MKRIHLKGDAWLLIGFLLILAAFSGFVAVRNQQIQEAQQTFVPLSTHTVSSDGALALFNWLQAIGYRPQRIENTAFQIGDDVRLLFVLAPTVAIEKSDAQYMLNWVSRGNVLVTTDAGLISSNALLSALDIRTAILDSYATVSTLEQPLPDTVNGPVTTNTYRALVADRTDFVEYLGAEGKSLLVRIPYGKGTVWVSSTAYFVTNENLSNDDNARLIRAMIASVPVGSAIAFDEYHLGFNDARDEVNLLTALYNTPWGWGVIFAFLLAFGYLILNGRRFGRTVPVMRTLARRTPSEYVVSMANLFRRANKRGMVLQHYRHSLKRRLGRAFHLNPELSDDQYLELLSRMRPELDRQELARILANLRRSDTSEADLVQAVEQSIAFGTRPRRSS